jgi:hypothetical protein
MSPVFWPTVPTVVTVPTGAAHGTGASTPAAGAAMRRMPRARRASLLPVGLLLLAVLGAAMGAAGDISVPIGPNSWVFDAAGSCTPSRITATEGIRQWSDGTLTIRTYLFVGVRGPLTIALNAAVSGGSSRIRCRLGAESREVAISTNVPSAIPLGTFIIEQPGYHYLELQGVARSGPTFAEITSLDIGGVAADQLHFIADDVHFGRRGPSVHLGYQLPPEAHELCFVYSEVRVPVGKDVVGTYCMANGFGEGYSGMQVNSLSERRILFSVWSPFATNDASKTPEADRVVLLRTGAGVHAQAFGGEGSGGQSFLVFPWRAGSTYRFLLGGRPDGDGTTVYSAYFWPPETGHWQLIASFRRPRTTTYLTHWYSFLENFSPDTGAITREADYGNQWACDASGRWFQAVAAAFSCDATAHKKARLDYTGGVTADGWFALRNCGFFSPAQPAAAVFTRPAVAQPPDIDLAHLPQE